MEDNQIESRKHSTEIEQLRAELIAQDHRLFTTLKRYFIERKTWPKDDPRHAAVKMALIYAFFSPAVIAVGGGGVALASLGVLLWQNSILMDQNALASKQNQLIASQNAFMQEQIRSNNRQWAAERKASLLSVIYDTEKCTHDQNIECPISNIKARTDAVIGLRLIAYDECKKSSCTLSLTNVNLNGAEFNNANISNTDFHESELDDSEFHDVEASSLRITRSEVSDIRFYNSNIKDCEINLTNFYKIRNRVSYAEFFQSNLQRCKVTIPSGSFRACFTGSDLTDSTIAVDLPPHMGEPEKIKQEYDFSYTNITNADLTRLEFLKPNQFNGACSNGGTRLPFNLDIPICKNKRQVPAYVVRYGCSLAPIDFFRPPPPPKPPLESRRPVFLERE